MKNYLLTLLVLFLFSCNSNTSKDEKKTKDTLGTKKSDLKETKTAEMDTKTKKAFVVYDGVTRYNNSSTLQGFKTYDFNGVFEFLFPVKPKFEKTGTADKYGYEKFKVSEVSEGTIFKIIVEDYSKDKSKTVSDMDVWAGHSTQWEFFGGKLNNDVDITLPNGSKAKYATFSWSLDGKDYLEDQVTIGLKKHIVYLKVISRPKFETKTKVSAFMSAFKAL